MRFPWSSVLDRPKEVERNVQKPIIPTTTSRPQPMIEIPVKDRQKRAYPNGGDSDQKHAPKRQRQGSVLKGDAPRSKQLRNKDLALTCEAVNGQNGIAAATIPRATKESNSGGPVKADVSLSSPSSPPPVAQSSSSMFESVLQYKLTSHSLDPSDSVRLAQLTTTIKSQFGLEILLKHQELRCIEQELAKCQTAYEQLRRCALVPYDAPHDTATAQTQSAQADASNWRTPDAILNGPYTRHYTKWLIPDPRFDGEPVPPDNKLERGRVGKRPVEGRTTRGSFADTVPQAGKARVRGIAGSTNGYLPSPSASQSRDKAGPLVLKRSSDGQMVKLVCLDCDRGDFSSAQGFINHCRIAHHRGFESHDAAANACGQVVEFDETGQVIDEGEPGSAGTVALVHPLIRLAPTTRPPPIQQSSWRNSGKEPTALTYGDRGTARQITTPQRPATTAALAAPVTPIPSASFNPSAQTPHLSALMRSKGHDGDLSQLVGEAKVRYDMESSSSSEGEGDGEDEGEGEGVGGEANTGHGMDGANDRSQAAAALSGSRIPARAGVSPAPLAQPGGTKGVERSRKPGMSHGFFSRSLHAQVATTPTPTPTVVTRPRQPRRQVDDVTLPPVDLISPNLSPNTLDAATAPSLVSDDGEYEAHSDSDALDSDEADEVEYGVEFDIEEGDEIDGRNATPATDPDLRHGPTASPKTPVPRRTALRRGTAALNNRRVHREERHVSFVSPVKEAEVKGRGARRGARK